jgi:hypothetical protein
MTKSRNNSRNNSRSKSKSKSRRQNIVNRGGAVSKGIHNFQRLARKVIINNITASLDGKKLPVKYNIIETDVNASITNKPKGDIEIRLTEKQAADFIKYGLPDTVMLEPITIGGGKYDLDQNEGMSTANKVGMVGLLILVTGLQLVLSNSDRILRGIGIIMFGTSVQQNNLVW